MKLFKGSQRLCIFSISEKPRTSCNRDRYRQNVKPSIWLSDQHFLGNIDAKVLQLEHNFLS